jgi:hypothetical protein
MLAYMLNTSLLLLEHTMRVRYNFRVLRVPACIQHILCTSFTFNTDRADVYI